MDIRTPMVGQRLLGSTILAAPAASMTVSGIPAGFNHLSFVALAASSAAGESDGFDLRINGDTGANYDTLAFYQANDTTGTNNHSGLGYATFYGATMPAASATAGSIGILTGFIPNYAGTTFRKVINVRMGYNDSQTAAADQAWAEAFVTWRSTSAVTSVTVLPDAGPNLITGSGLWVYGVL